jgi:protein TonB
MFEESLVESAHLLRSTNRWPAVAAFAFQAALATAIVTIPLLHPAVLGLRKEPVLLNPPAPKPPEPPPPIHRVRVATGAPTSPATPQPTPPTPSPTPITSSPIPSTTDAPSLLSLPMSTATSHLDSAIAPAAASRPSVVAASPAPHPSAPLRISGGVSAGLLLAPIRPTYPAIARLTRTEGTVIVHAIISKTGSIESASIVSGPAVLQSAAIDAVRSARYHPFLLNGDPVEVDTTFSIVFRMNN